jgi:hypothetical protein
MALVYYAVSTVSGSNLQTLWNRMDRHRISFTIRLFRVPSSLFDTLSMFVITVTVYSPVSTLLALPGQANMISTMSTIKPLNLSFWGVIQRLRDEMVSRGSQGDPLGDVQFVIIPIGSVGVIAESW